MSIGNGKVADYGIGVFEAIDVIKHRHAGHSRSGVCFACDMQRQKMRQVGCRSLCQKFIALGVVGCSEAYLSALKRKLFNGERLNDKMIESITLISNWVDEIKSMEQSSRRAKKQQTRGWTVSILVALWQIITWLIYGPRDRSDVLAEQWMERKSDEPTVDGDDSATQDTTRAGYIYVMEDSDQDLGSVLKRYKVGRSNDVARRFASLRTASCGLRIVLTLWFDDCITAEQLIHTKLKAYRVTASDGTQTEWFNCNLQTVALASMDVYTETQILAFEYM